MIQCLFYFTNWHVFFLFSLYFFLFFMDQLLIICLLLFLLSFSIHNSLFLTFFLVTSVINLYIYIYFNNAHNHCPCLCTFSIKCPLQLNIACNQTKVNVENFPGTYFFLQPTQTISVFNPFFFNFWPPSIGLSLIFSIANKYLLSFSFNKYLYKTMACIQPSFLHFYLFRPWQRNTSFLLTSKMS